MLSEFLLQCIVFIWHFYRTGNPWVGGSHSVYISYFSDTSPGAQM